MPAVTSTTEEQTDPEQRMWNALKWHITRERQRKKQEYEAEVEEERLRKEREARERQDVMTLEETKEQIEQLEQKLKQLEKEKQQLFMKLKKVLNEDENRKRQQQKESNENQPMKMQMSNIQIPMFPMSTSTGQGEQMPTQGRPPPLTSHMLNKQTIVRGPIQAGAKRARSPSPTYALYSQRLHQPPMKHQQVYSDHKVEDGRRPLTRAVLWNKQRRGPCGESGGAGRFKQTRFVCLNPTPALARAAPQGPAACGAVRRAVALCEYIELEPSQYGSNSASVSSQAYYAMPTSGVVVGERPPPLLYAHHAHTPHTPHTPHHANLMYAPAPQPQQLYLDMLKNRDGQHPEPKKEAQPGQVLIGLSEAHASVSTGVVYAQPPPVSRHLSIHPPAHSMQTSKPGSITQGYPVQQSNPNVQNPNIYPNRHRY